MMDLSAKETSPGQVLLSLGQLDEARIFAIGASYSNIDPQLKQAILLLSKLSFLSVVGKDGMMQFATQVDEDSEEMNFLRQCAASNAFQDNVAVVASFVRRNDPAFVAILTLVQPLLERTEVLLSLGGDDRLTIDFNGLKINKYFSSTLPRPGMVRRGSCTCSTITGKDYLAADALRLRLLTQVLTHAHAHSQLSSIEAKTVVGVEAAVAAVLSDVDQDLRVRLRTALGLAPGAAELVLFPSGSDAELLPLVLALARAGSEGVVYNFLTAAGEVGSGTPNAAGGRHFSALSPRGSHPYPHLSGMQTNNGLLRGWEKHGEKDKERVVVVQYKPRAGDGSVDFQEARLVADVCARLAAGEGSEVDQGARQSSRNVAVLHVVCGSKTGLVCPSQATIDVLKAQWGDRLVVVVDACQVS